MDTISQYKEKTTTHATTWVNLSLNVEQKKPDTSNSNLFKVQEQIILTSVDRSQTSSHLF